MGDFVATNQRIDIGGLDQAERLALRIGEPVAEKPNPVFVLNLEIAPVCFSHVVRRRVSQTLVYIHIYWHELILENSPILGGAANPGLANTKMPRPNPGFRSTRGRRGVGLAISAG